MIDTERVRDDSQLDDVCGFSPLGGGHQIDVISDTLKKFSPSSGVGKIGVELGMSNYLPEGNLASEEHNVLRKALPNATFINSIDIIDELSMYKELDEINRFRKASDIVDISHKAVLNEIKVGMTETEIASGYRTAYPMGSCTPATRRRIRAVEPMIVDLHEMFKLGLGDHAYNYLISHVSKIQKNHAQNFIETITRVIDLYAPNMTPGKITDDMMDWADSKGFAQFLVPDLEHGIGMMRDEWRIRMNNGPLPY